MHCLISGGAGYIGSVLVPYLLGLGHHVTVLDNFQHRQNSLARCCAWKEFNVVRGDARDIDLLAELTETADLIIPLAALVGAPMCEQESFAAESTNTYAIGDLCSVTDKPIIIPITNSGYGIGEPGQKCTEESPLRPISLYGKTKVAAEQIVMKRGNAISLRLATVFGMSPRMRLDLLVNDFVYRAVTDRNMMLYEPYFRRNFIHIQDVAFAFAHAVINFDKMRDNIYNVGLSDANLTKLELCERIKKYVPEFRVIETALGEDPDKRDYEVDNSKIEAAGFKPTHSLDDGIIELIKGCRMLRNTRYGNV